MDHATITRKSNLMPQSVLKSNDYLIKLLNLLRQVFISTSISVGVAQQRNLFIYASQAK